MPAPLFSNAPNLRDLAMVTSDPAHPPGKTIKPGKLFRSGALHLLQADDWRRLADMGLKTVCDFRRDSERERSPTDMETAAKLGIQVISMEVNPGNHSDFLRTIMLNEQADRDQVFQLMHQVNRELALNWGHRFRQLFDHILELNESEALIFHCSAGKDRTGFAAALILLALDMPMATVQSDYLLTQQYFVPEQQIAKFLTKRVREQWSDAQLQKIYPVFETHLSYLQAGIKVIDNYEGGQWAYLQEKIGLTESERAHLQAKLLHPSF